jgi:flagellar biosynthesis GTPase FlhF
MKRPLLRKLRLISLCILLFPAILFAETIFLKNGTSVSGKIVGQSRTTVTIRDGGATRVIQKSDIRRISYDTNNNEAAEERRRKAEEARRKREEDARKQAEEEARKTEEEARKAEEQDAQKAEEEARRKQAETARQEAEARRKKEAAYKAAGPHRLDAFLRSLVLPGWGQAYQGRTNAAYGLGGGFLAGLGLSYYFEQRYNIARGAYEDKADEFFITSPLVLSSLGSSISSPTTLAPLGLVLAQDTSDARKRMENAGRLANNTRTLLLGLYLWNLVDVMVFHPSQTESVGVSVGPGRVGVRYSLRF